MTAHISLTASLSRPTAKLPPVFESVHYPPSKSFVSFYYVGVVAFALVESWKLGSRFSECYDELLP
jgi:hypothetical protein